jgi:hypothetical protein
VHGYGRRKSKSRISVKSGLTERAIQDKELLELEELRKERDRSELIARYFASIEKDKVAAEKKEVMHNDAMAVFEANEREVAAEEAQSRLPKPKTMTKLNHPRPDGSSPNECSGTSSPTNLRHHQLRLTKLQHISN